MIAVDIRAATTSSPPAIEAKDKNKPWGVPAAVKDEMTSGAPFPSAKRVTPANVSDNLSFWEMNYKELTKYSSAVDPSKYIEITKIPNEIGMNIR